MKKLAVLSFPALAVAAACDNNPAGLLNDATHSGEIVITEGIRAPGPVPGRPSLSNFASPTFSTVGGSDSEPVSLKPNTCTPAEGNSQTITINFRVSGPQGGTYTFKVPSSWSYNGSAWSGSNRTTVTVPAQGAGSTTSWPVLVTITNNSGVNSGTSSFNIAPQDVSGSGTPALQLNPSNPATVHVEFVACPVTNTPPTLTLPGDITQEATGSSGAVVTFDVSADDAQDGDISDDVICAPASGSVFPLGETTVNCSVTDSGGETTNGSFKVTVEDSTPPVINGAPSGTVTLIAANSSGATYDVSGITATDIVDGDVAVSCSDASAGIGQTKTVTCSATDNAGNLAKVEFDIYVTLNSGEGYGFLPPLREEAPYSAHKLKSTVPHKIPAPKYADGSLATDLADADHLRLVLVALKSDGSVDATDVLTESTAASTAWRYDSVAKQYIFNLTTNGLKAGTDYRTTVSIGAVELAQTVFGVRK